MKKLILSLLFFFTIANLFAQEQMFGPLEISNLPEKSITRNKIKLESIYNYSFHKNRTDSTLESNISYKYDENGNIKEMFKQSDVKDYGKYRSDKLLTYAFNEKGMLMNQVFSDIRSGRSNKLEILYSLNFEYDSANRLEYIYDFNSDTTHINVLKCVYNDFSQLVQVYKKSDEGEFMPNFNVLYDKKGRDSLFNRMDEKHVDFSYLYEYDEVLHKKSMSLITGKFIKQKTLEEESFYNINNQLIKFIKITDTPTDKPIIKYTYNDDGTLATETKYYNGEIIKFTRHYYQK